jgi:NAD(P)-dependent dehydrogenase (short-subunit alcohol dehydrogenase family)
MSGGQRPAVFPGRFQGAIFMPRTILVTGATDGIGLLTARSLAEEGHHVLLHGRSREKLEDAARTVGAGTQTFLADLSRTEEVEAMADAILSRHDRLDVLINNAGVYKVPQPRLADGQDVRFVVNTIAPYILTRRLLPVIPRSGRVVNLSSAAQAPVDVDALLGRRPLDDMEAYAQSKLGIVIWTRALADELPGGPAFVAVNPGSLLASKMVREGFGVAGKDPGIGARILCRAALSPEFATATGLYFDNDAARFSEPVGSARDSAGAERVMAAIRQLAN